MKWTQEIVDLRKEDVAAPKDLTAKRRSSIGTSSFRKQRAKTCGHLAAIYQTFTIPTQNMVDINTLLASFSSLSPAGRTALLVTLGTPASVQLSQDIGDTECLVGKGAEGGINRVYRCVNFPCQRDLE